MLPWRSRIPGISGSRGLWFTGVSGLRGLWFTEVSGKQGSPAHGVSG